jgi:hypothetical protein
MSSHNLSCSESPRSSGVVNSPLVRFKVGGASREARLWRRFSGPSTATLLVPSSLPCSYVPRVTCQLCRDYLRTWD